MAILTIQKGAKTLQQEFAAPQMLDVILESAGVYVVRPCGGRGVCGKCAVEVSGQISEPSPAERKRGMRLACETVVQGDARVVLREDGRMDQIQTTDTAQIQKGAAMAGAVGTAVDIGTTTVALRRYDLKSGRLLGQSAMENPQVSVAADVMGRIDAAMHGQLEKLQSQIVDAIHQLQQQAGGSSDSMVLTGNTTMLYLLTGRDPQSLSQVPFAADCLFDREENILGAAAYLPPCMNAFVGADITCAVLASEMCREEISLLCDIGTNGEIALWKEGTLYVTSTAAGPAFEGAGISCGCGSVKGAIDKVWVEDRQLQIHTIADVPAVGICGSGIVDAVAKLLELELLDETGALEEDAVELAPGVALNQKDIRMVQLSKAAIAAGIQTLMTVSNTAYADVQTLYIAGGFGSHLDIDSAGAIGLIPQELKEKVKVIGNAALAGASQLLLDVTKLEQVRQIAASAKHWNLGGNPLFNANYVEQMLFCPSDEL